MRIRQINIYRLVTVLFALLLFSSNATARYINMTEAWISMDEEKDGELGIIIHIDFTVNGIKGEPVQVTSFIESPKGTCMRDTNGKYCDTGGYVATSNTIWAPYAETKYTDYQLFIPYMEIHPKKGTHTYYCNIRFYDQNRKKFLTEPSYIDFELNSEIEYQPTGTYNKEINGGANNSDNAQLPNSGDWYFLGRHLQIRNGCASNSWLICTPGGAWNIQYKGYNDGWFCFVWLYTYTDFTTGYPYPLRTKEHPFWVSKDFSVLVDENNNRYKACSKNTYESIRNDNDRLLNGGGTGYSSGGSTTGGSYNHSSGGSIVCKYCGGNGCCSSCKGKGYKFNNYSAHNDTCPNCNGSGKCFNCHGSGRQR